MPGDGHDPADGHHREREERRQERQVRREEEDLAVGGVGHRLFLEEELDAVGQRLEQPERAGAVGPDPVLHARDHLAQEPDVHEHGDQYEREHRDRLADHDQHDREVDAVGEERIGDGDDGHPTVLTVWSRPGARSPTW